MRSSIDVLSYRGHGPLLQAGFIIPIGGMNPLTGLGIWVQQYVLSRRKKTPLDHQRGFSYKCLTMTYFHGRMPTIIGAKAFHCPVRNGKGVVPPCYCHQA